MYDFALKEFDLNVCSKEQLKEELTILKISYSEFKYQYRKKYECIETINYDLEVNQDFIDFYKEFKKKSDYSIVFRTSRPELLYPGTLLRTKEWLKYIGIENHNVEIKNEDSIKLYRPLFHIDDEIEHLNLQKKYMDSSQLFLYKPYKKENESLVDFKIIKSLTELCQIIPHLI